MVRLLDTQVNQALNELAGIDAIIFDLRGYPNGILYLLADYLLPQARTLARYQRPDLSDPGRFIEEQLIYGGSRWNGYQGRLMLLLDEQSVSQSEFTAMVLQSHGNVLSFGSQTGAADGDITELRLPGGISTYFSGLGIYYPDGRSTQRIGIVPDVAVYPTAAGLRAGRYEVLEAALDCNGLNRQPAPRSPEPGLYFNAERSGEGLEVHRLPLGYTLIHYGYDDAGNPDWALGIAESRAQADWVASMDRFEPQLQANAAGAITLNRHRGAYQPVCAIVDQQHIAERMRMRWQRNDGDLDECVEPLFQSGASALTGLWAGPENDRGWGLGIHRRGNTLAVLLYAFDQDHQPRWALGTTTIDTNGVAEVPMQRYAGFCRSCAAQAVTSVAAGSIRLQLNDNGSGSADIDVQTSSSFHWQRQNLALERLTPAGVVP